MVFNTIVFVSQTNSDVLQASGKVRNSARQVYIEHYA